jgi:hypothetical protein
MLRFFLLLPFLAACSDSQWICSPSGAGSPSECYEISTP